MSQAQSIPTGNIKVDIFMSSFAVLFAIIGNMPIDLWLQRTAWIGAIVVSAATLAKIFVIDFKLFSKQRKNGK